MNIVRRAAIWLATVASLLVAGMTVAVPSASAADQLDNPSGSWTISCGGAEAKIQIKWKSPSVINVWWRLTDTDQNGKSPVLRIHAHDYQHDASAWEFGTGNNYYVLSGGGTVSARKLDWNPGAIGGINHLWIQVKDGTEGEGSNCTKEKNIYNWTALAYSNALDKQGAPYVWGGTGPGYDCSGLVYASYNQIAFFPDWSVRASRDMYSWVRSHTAESKFYAEQVSYADAMQGDLIFYDFSGDGVVDHVAFYAGNGNVFDAQQEGVPVGYHNEYGSDDRMGVFRILGVETV
ncbi:C40 family peptidase [Glycomyces terrestris]|nr:NlpC/P60 family protein [Glycomyces terrestris]